MNFLQARRLVKILILFLILAILVVTFLSLSRRKEDSHLLKGLKFFSKLGYANGISFVEYRGDKKIYAVSIDSFSVERASFGPFAIGPLIVAYINNLNVDLYGDGMKFTSDTKTSEEKSAMGGILDFETPISNIRKNLPPQAKSIKAIKINKLSISLWNDEKRIFRISSDAAAVDRKTGDLIFTGHAIMDGGENGNLVSHRIRWDKKTRLFNINDPFILTKGNNRTEGAGIETDFLFNRINYRSSNE